METLSNELLATARKTEKSILQQLASVGLSAPAAAIGVDESTISRLKGSDQRINFKSLSIVLSTIGLKVVPEGVQCYRPEDIDPYIALAKRHMNTIDGAEHLVWDE